MHKSTLISGKSIFQKVTQQAFSGVFNVTSEYIQSSQETHRNELLCLVSCKPNRDCKF